MRTTFDDSAHIKVLSRPRAAPGSLRAKRFSRLRNGMTVGGYLNAAHRATDARHPVGRYRSDVSRLLGAGHIVLDE